MYALYKIKQNKNKLVNILANLFLENPAKAKQYKNMSGLQMSLNVFNFINILCDQRYQLSAYENM